MVSPENQISVFSAYGYPGPVVDNINTYLRENRIGPGQIKFFKVDPLQASAGSLPSCMVTLRYPKYRHPAESEYIARLVLVEASHATFAKKQEAALNEISKVYFESQSSLPGTDGAYNDVWMAIV